jgi:hypothetical protein
MLWLREDESLVFIIRADAITIHSRIVVQGGISDRLSSAVVIRLEAESRTGQHTAYS